MLYCCTAGGFLPNSLLTLLQQWFEETQVVTLEVTVIRETSLMTSENPVFCALSPEIDFPFSVRLSFNRRCCSWSWYRFYLIQVGDFQYCVVWSLESSSSSCSSCSPAGELFDERTFSSLKMSVTKA